MRALRPTLLLLAAVAGPACDAPATRPRNLLLITLDTVRRDHLSTYGYARPTSPRLDRLAREATVFDNAYAQETNTNPSHASMFTGVYPHVHGALDNRWVLPDGQITLAQILEREGFRTGGFVSGAPMIRELTGLERGFEIYDDAFEGTRRDGGETTERALDWLAAEDDPRPFFLFLHLYDAHGPYAPSTEYADLFSSAESGPTLEDIPRYQQTVDEQGRLSFERGHYIDRYDAQIRYVDDLLGRALDAVDLDRTLVLVLADHGETLDERYHKFDHGAQSFDEQIRIPLVLRAPAGRGRRVDSLVETVDLLPTVLELLGVDPPADRPLQGRSLVPSLDGREQDPRAWVFSAARPDSYRHRDRGYVFEAGRRIQSIRSRDWKLIRYPGRETDPLELYDLRADPGETRNIAGSYATIARGMMDALLAWEADAMPTVEAPPPLDDETRERLRSLGYVQ